MAVHSLAPIRAVTPVFAGWGEGVAMIPYRTAGDSSSLLLPSGEKE